MERLLLSLSLLFSGKIIIQSMSQKKKKKTSGIGKGSGETALARVAIVSVGNGRFMAALDAGCARSCRPHW